MLQICLVALFVLGVLSESRSYTVTVAQGANGDPVWNFAGLGNNPALTANLGDVITFNIDVPTGSDYPFAIHTANDAGTETNRYTNVSPIVRNTDGPIVLTIGENSPRTLYYVSERHASMMGSITVNGLADCTGAPTDLPANSALGNCPSSGTTTTATSCTPVCNKYYTGSLSSFCANGRWTTTGSCFLTNCTQLPIVINAVSGNCVANSIDGTTCTPQCQAGFTGTISVTCVAGVWQASGHCASTSGAQCTTAPTFANTNPSQCTIPANSGSTCRLTCPSSMVGSVLATCDSGTWFYDGSCDAPSCSLSDLNLDSYNANAGDCTSVTDNGSSCNPTCKSGLVGSLRATCSNGVWSVSGSCGRSCGRISIINANAGNCGTTTLSGSSCTPVCKDNYEGTLTARCVNGTWATTGSCTLGLLFQITILGTTTSTCDHVENVTVPALNNWVENELEGSGNTLVMEMVECNRINNNTNEFRFEGTVSGSSADNVINNEDFWKRLENFLEEDPTITITDVSVSGSTFLTVSVLALLSTVFSLLLIA